LVAQDELSRGDLRHTITSATVPIRDRRQIGAKSSVGGKMRGAAMPIGGSRKKGAKKKSAERQIKSAFGWKKGTALRSDVAWMRSAAAKRLASPSGWLVRER
jgi:hypothetical protein